MIDRIVKKIALGKNVNVHSSILADVIEELTHRYVVDGVTTRILSSKFTMIIPNDKLIQKI